MLRLLVQKPVVFLAIIGLTMGIGKAADDSQNAKDALTARKVEIQKLKQKLAAADSPEAKRAALDQYRAKTERALAEKRALQPQAPAKTSQELVAELKARAGDGPAMQKRVAELVEEFRSEQRRLAQERQQEMAARPASESIPQELPPAMQAIRAKAEERKQEIETLKAALEQTQPQERVELIDAFRAKQKAAAAERMRELEARQAEQSQGAVQP